MRDLSSLPKLLHQKLQAERKRVAEWACKHAYKQDELVVSLDDLIAFLEQEKWKRGKELG